jgi:peptide/nickel transport system substrate-binding protein
MVAFNQKDFLDAVIGDPAYYKLCKALFPCGSPNSSTKGMEGFLDSNVEREGAARRGHDGTPGVFSSRPTWAC